VVKEVNHLGFIFPSYRCKSYRYNILLELQGCYQYSFLFSTGYVVSLGICGYVIVVSWIFVSWFRLFIAMIICCLWLFRNNKIFVISLQTRMESGSALMGMWFLADIISQTVNWMFTRWTSFLVLMVWVERVIH
jgi:hypothetical protein